MPLPQSILNFPTPTLGYCLRVCSFSIFPLVCRVRISISHFHLSPTLSAYAKDLTHYDALNLPQHATAAEIKRRFYELSKTHHPDRNKDPQASNRFIAISNAYSIIGNEKKREQYDRELTRRGGIVHPHSQQNGPAGGRPAHGLSRRRTHLHGPPNSFFRSGGYEKYRHRMRTSDTGASAVHVAGGMGFSGAPSGRNDDVPHFDFERHRMQQERRRKSVGAPALRAISPGIILPLLGVGTLLLLTYTVSTQSRDGENKSRS